ncbi:LysM peptidoglycan-binding domain-containing protein [Aspergillus mulundensis]|uniref:LysM domain-containing protein n=1 Tax=Aspergillus mulundensis TaxID=1810919 RepID=A0A3D8T340_9EURO|nr:hypothetical protein DSM5745_00272 [Aspergillus mulundensis]RDW92950.1 hypothetical protein DSM5745_00272 [Aspergillus mulundensis]
MACRLFAAFAVSLVVTGSDATQFLTDKTLPEGTLSDECASALVSNISCPYQVATFLQDRYYPVESLAEACTPSCEQGLAAYEEGIFSACSDADVYRQSETRYAPAYAIPMEYLYYYNKTCIRDDERWCHNVAHQMATGEIAADRCDDCVIKQWQFVAGSPMYAGNQLRSSYTALTESCSKTGFPLAPSTSLPAASGTATPTPTPSTCSGKAYTIQPGDTCQSISKSQGIGTAQLLVDNDLAAYCNGFPTQGDLCINHACTTHTVAANETCADIGRKYIVTQVQLTTWNPILGQDCRHIERSVGDSICVSPPGDDGSWTPITIPSAASSTATPIPTPAPVPTNLANGTVRRCSQYYLVEPGDYCNKIILKYSISLEDFLFLNQGVNQNCTNLFADESYCVSPLGSIDDYPGAPGYIDPSATYSDIAYSSYPTATFTPPLDVNQTTLLLISPDGRKDCYLYVAGTELQIDVSGTFYTSPCQAIAEAWGKAVEDLESWNPSISANGTCSFSPNFRYCMDPNRPTDSGLVTTRTSVPSSGTSATSVSATASVSTTATATATTTTTSEGPPGPTQSGIPDNCNKWHLVTSSEENCSSVAAEYNISLEQFYSWNPAVSEDCVDGFWKDEAYCVGIAE